MNKEMKTLTFGDVTYEVVDEKARQDLQQKISNTDKGRANGIASLDNNGKVPSNQLPEIKSYDVGGEELGVVKNGGNVVINPDGTMTAPESGEGTSVQSDWNATESNEGAIKNKPPVFNWKRYFRRLIGNSITSEIQLTRMRPSKRFPDARGIRMKRKPNIMVAVDTSGSISQDDLKDFFSEIHHIWKTGVNVTVVEIDT